jgi:isopentenyl diphosphate isomerase/L-lactate dehydrogenase-like FMN-dependent dehydrogenase
MTAAAFKRQFPAGRKALTLADYRDQARDRFAPEVWDFCEGGAGEERTLAANLAAFDRVTLLPRVLHPAADPDLSTTILGERWAAPMAIAPMAFHALAHPDGEPATARAAGEIGVPTVVATMSGSSFEEIAEAATAPLWLQVYCLRERSRTARMIERAERAGMSALVLTVDTPRLGRRLRDIRNDFRLPRGITPVNLDGDGFTSPSDHARSELDSGLDWSILGWLRSISSLPVLVKGVLTGQDAVLAVEAGADGIVVSNHGGRQLDGVPATFEALPEIVAAVAGRCTVLVDGGIRRGSDVLACLAAGANAVLIGRPVLHGLAVGGAAGAADVLAILREELSDAMTLTGTPSLAAVRADLIRFPQPSDHSLSTVGQWPRD